MLKYVQCALGIVCTDIVLVRFPNCTTSKSKWVGEVVRFPNTLLPKDVGSSFRRKYLLGVC